jgi:hypothetical protein
MSRELVVCIRVAVYDKIQTAQLNVVAPFFSNTESPFPENHVRERKKS